MPKLLGTYFVKMEETGRIRLPSHIAECFGDTVFLYRGEGPVVMLYPRDEHEKIIEKLNELDPLLDENQRWRLRGIGRSLEEVQIKVKGRLTLPKTFREHGDFRGGEEIMLIGCLRYAELWKSEDVYNAEERMYRERRLVRG